MQICAFEQLDDNKKYPMNIRSVYLYKSQIWKKTVIMQMHYASSWLKSRDDHMCITNNVTAMKVTVKVFI